MSSPSLTLTLWGGSWLSGHTSIDDMIDALQVWAPLQLVAAHDEPASVASGVTLEPVVGAATLSAVIRRAAPTDGSGIRLVLPAPGDVQGLPTGTAFARAALAGGQGVLVGVPGAPGLGLVPVVEGPDVLRWNVFAVPELPEPSACPGLGEAEFTLREAVRGAAETLTGIRTVGLDGRRTDPRAEIADAVAEQARHRYPDHLPARAVRILDSADQVAAILTVASGGRGLQAGSASAVSMREEALRPLWTTVRTARLTAVTATLESWHRSDRATGR